jgi:hypothetical protein
MPSLGVDVTEQGGSDILYPVKKGPRHPEDENGPFFMSEKSTSPRPPENCSGTAR